MTERSAIYFSPEHGDPLEGFGSRWIGRSAFTGKKLPQYEIQGLASAELAKITEEPRHYGFHATLRAPFCLNGRKTGTEFVDAVCDLAAKHAPFICSNLRLSRIGGFLVLTMDEP